MLCLRYAAMAPIRAFGWCNDASSKLGVCSGSLPVDSGGERALPIVTFKSDWFADQKALPFCPEWFSFGCGHECMLCVP
jgi:hypothetical protein